MSVVAQDTKPGYLVTIGGPQVGIQCCRSSIET